MISALTGFFVWISAWRATAIRGLDDFYRVKELESISIKAADRFIADLNAERKRNARSELRLLVECLIEIIHRCIFRTINRIPVEVAALRG